MDVLLSFGIEKLWDLLSQKYTHFTGVQAQVTELKTKLKKLESFMIDASAKTHNKNVQNSLEEIKEIIYDADDILETFILRDQLRRNGGIKKHIGWIVSFLPERMKIASDMKDIGTRISKEIADMQSFGVIEQRIHDGRECSHPRQGLKSSMRQEFPGEWESHFVGIEENVEKLVGYLMEEDNVQVVSVTGMGGLGKTTLARQVINHDKIKSKFNRLAWVCVTQEFDHKSVWQTILKNFKTKEEEEKIMRMEESTLQGELFHLLETSKSLIIIDDIWEQEHWDMLRKIFPTKKGWKVLLTSRNVSVAGQGDTLIKFKLECLTDQESWTLFQKIAFSRKDASELKIDEEMETMAKQMVKHCGGLPLAVRVLGSLLAKKPHDWRRISVNIGSHIMGGRTNGNNTPLNHVLSLSFAELPRYLQYCFLYLAHFPEDYKIDVEELSYCWAAEGIFKELSYYDGESIRDVGESCIEELVMRNMVISKRDFMTQRFETCQLHDMMREICLSKAKEENFLHFLGIHSQTAHTQPTTTSRRFVSQRPTILHVKGDINNPKIRSLVVVLDNVRTSYWDLSSLSFTRLQLLRVLHIPHVGFEDGKLPSSIGEFIHLRYLNLEDAMVHNIPSSLGNLTLLIYLNIAIYSLDPTFVPNVFMGMKYLRYLALPFYMDEKTKLELSNLVDLETLINFSRNNISLEDLHGMSRLRTLRIKLTGERSLQILSASIRGLRHLENLDIHYDEAKSLKEVDGTTLDFKNLKQLKLRIMHALPDELNLPSRLTRLTLDYGCNWKEDPMPILEKLRHLKEVCLVESFSSKKMVCSTGGFPQLQKLKLWALNEWEEWIVEEGSMPLLHTLIILRCEKLKELSDGLRFTTSLKYLEVSSEEEKWKERLSEGGEDYYKIQHIPSVKIQVLEDVKTILRGLFSDDSVSESSVEN